MTFLADHTGIEIPIAEDFYSLQGEGDFAGSPAVFCRFGGCNLLCGKPDNPDAPQEDLTPDGDDATWVCDTIETWRNPTQTTVGSVVARWRDHGWLDHLHDGTANLVFTGGEPLLQQDGNVNALAELCDAADAATVELETNGTIVPTAETDAHIDQYNVSVKLANSGMSEDRRRNPESLDYFADHDDATFKFVVSRQRDVRELQTLADEYAIAPRDIMLMPAGASVADLHDDDTGTAERVADLCKDHGYRYSPRLHIDIWDTATGV